MRGLRLLLLIAATATLVGSAAAESASAAKAPTKLWYRIRLTYTGTTSHTYDTNTGPVVNAGRWTWAMKSRNAVIVYAVCTRLPTRRRPQATTTDGRCPKGRRGVVQDIRFLADTNGELTNYSFSTTLRRPDFGFKSGRMRDCERSTNRYSLARRKVFDGGIGGLPASQGVLVTMGILPLDGDATAQLPVRPFTCTLEDADPANPGMYLNGRAEQVPAGTPTPTLLTDLDKGIDYAYGRGSQTAGILPLRVGRRFGRAIDKSWNLTTYENSAGGNSRIRVVERYSLLLRPCPRGGRDVDSC
jgi:hypothetical protein